MKHSVITIMLLSLLTSCNRNTGPDSLSSHVPLPGSVVSNCTAICHSPNSTTTPDPIATNGSGTAGKHIVHVSSFGLSCDRCHFNYAANPAHFNGQINSKGIGTSPVYFDSLNSGAVWSYDAALQTGNCSATACHSTAVLDWYGTANWVLPPCDVCHNAPIGTRRQVLGPSGDFAANLSVISRHVTGPSDPTPEQCRICHDPYLHMSGTVRLRNLMTGSGINYNPDSPATLESFCLGCHNATGATTTYVSGGSSLSPFNDSSTIGTIPYVMSATIASSWNGVSVHRNRGLTCVGSGVTGSGCHGSNGSINVHGSINPGLLTNKMNFRIPVVSYAVFSADPIGSSFSYDNYKLCFDCHESHPKVTKEVVLGYRANGAFDLPRVAPTPYYTSAIQSLFRDRYIANPSDYPAYWSSVNQSYNDTIPIFGQPNLALHNYHLLGFAATFGTTTNLLVANYRGDTMQPGRIQCTACHDVHGSALPTVRSTHKELGLQTFIGLSGDVYSSLISSVLSSTIMTSQPMNCAYDCHAIQGQTNYWHTPSGE